MVKKNTNNVSELKIKLVIENKEQLDDISKKVAEIEASLERVSCLLKQLTPSTKN